MYTTCYVTHNTIFKNRKCPAYQDSRRLDLRGMLKPPKSGNMTKANACKGKKKSSNRQGKVRKFAPVALILASLFSSVSNYDVIELVVDDSMTHAVCLSRIREIWVNIAHYPREYIFDASGIYLRCLENIASTPREYSIVIYSAYASHAPRCSGK